MLRKELERLLEELKKHPDDPRLLQKIGELHHKLGEIVRAAEYFVAVANVYQRDGFFLKATAVLRQVLKLRPGHFEAHQRLAITYTALGFTQDAVAHLAVVAEAHARAGDAEAALHAYDKIRELDPHWKPSLLQ